MADLFGPSHMGKHEPQFEELSSEGPGISNQLFYQDSLGQSTSSALPTINEHRNAGFPNKCAECPFILSKKGGLDQHATETGHIPFLCTCGAKYARSYCLTRHINSSIGPGFPCGLCDDRSFPRQDKLQDHLRRYHKLGHSAFNQYKHGGTFTSSDSLPTSQRPLLPVGITGSFYSPQIYPVAPSCGSMPVYDGFPPIPNAAPEVPVEYSVSPGSTTAAENLWDNNTAYPLYM